MSRFFSEKYKNLIPYTPGEQPRDMQYIKLNTNESPFPPSPVAIRYAEDAAKTLQLYPDPTYSSLTEKLAKKLGVTKNQMLVTNGSDEILNFAFMAFCDKNTPAVFPDISYGFYSVFAEINNVPYEEKPLNNDFTININDYIGCGKTVFIANPNAPTGIFLSLSEIEKIVASNPDNIVVIDEAYVDFGAQSAIALIDKYDNLLVTQTFSKSRSMAGGRIGFGVASEALINDLNTIKYSTNPYNINRMSAACAEGILEDDEYTVNNCKTIVKNREYLEKSLESLGFYHTDSKANFVFAKHDKISGKTLYEKLKSRGVLIRHFDKERICQFNRITVGTLEQIEILISEIKGIMEE